MTENGLYGTDNEKFLLSRLNTRPDILMAELVEDGLISKEEAMEFLVDFPEIIESPDSLKIFYFHSSEYSIGEGYEESWKLYKKYPNQMRMNNIDDADIFSFVCTKEKDEYWIHHDTKRLLDYSKSKNKVLWPIISDFSLGYEMITIVDTDLSFKIYGIDDREPIEPEEQEPEIIK